MRKDGLKNVAWDELLESLTTNEIKLVCEGLLEKYGNEEDKELLYLQYSNAPLIAKIELITDNLGTLIDGYTYEFIKDFNGEYVCTAIELCNNIYSRWCNYISLLRDEIKTDRSIFLNLLLDFYLEASSLDFNNDPEPSQLLQDNLVELVSDLLDLHEDKSADILWNFVKRDYPTMSQANIDILDMLFNCMSYSESYYCELEKNYNYLLEHTGVWKFNIDVEQILQSMLELFDYRGDTYPERKTFYDTWETYSIVRDDKEKNEMRYMYTQGRYKEYAEKLEEYRLKLEIGSKKWEDASFNLIKIYRILSDNKNLANSIKKYVSEIRQQDYSLFLELKNLVLYDDWILFLERGKVASLNESVLEKLYIECGLYSELFKCYEIKTELLHIQKHGKILYEKDPERYIALYVKALDILYRELREKKKQENIIPHIRMFLANYPASEEVKALCMKWKQESITEKGFIRKIDTLLSVIN